MSVIKEEFGVVDGQKVFQYSLSRGFITVKILTFGGIVRVFNVKDCDIVLGYNDLDGYLQDNSTYFGAIIGRVANRIGDAHFYLDGKKYNLYNNDGSNTLHGGKEGFNRKIWQAEITGEYSVKLSYLSADGEENFPANLSVSVEYSLTERNGLKIEYFATSDADTPVNLTNHSYFNLNGEGNGDILGHTLKINAEYITPVNSALIPTGKFLPVKNSPFDFNESKKIGKDICADNEQINNCGGYDINYVIKDCAEPVAEVIGDISKIKMQVFSTEKGIQFYSGNFLNNVQGKSGIYCRRGALCLETQAFPDSVNHDNFPSIILKAGEIYHSVTEYVIVL